MLERDENVLEMRQDSLLRKLDDATVALENLNHYVQMIKMETERLSETRTGAHRCHYQTQ